MHRDAPKVLVAQAVRRGTSATIDGWVNFYRREGVEHLLPAQVDSDGHETPLDYREGLDTTRFYAPMFTKYATDEDKAKFA